MRIAVTTTGLVLTEALKVDVRRRVLLAMSRFGQEVQDVTVHLAESHNPLGGVDQYCRLRACLGSGPVLRAQAVNGELEAAVSRSVTRLARLVAAELDGGDDRTSPTRTSRLRGADE